MADKQHVRSRHSSLSGNSVPFPVSPSLSRQLSGLSLVDLESLGYSYPAAYSRLSRDSISYHQSHQVRSPAGSNYSYRTRRGTQQLSPVAEESDERSRSGWTRSHVSSPISTVYPPGASSGPDDTFVEDIAFAMMMMIPSPRVEMKNGARRRRAKRSRTRATYLTAKRAAGATRRVISAVGRAILCPPWQWARQP